MPPRILYGILRLRATVFVVEQNCVYLDVDGRDLEEGAMVLWIEDAGEVVGCARVLQEEQGCSIGRVVTHPSRRGEGIGANLVRRALELADAPTVIHAQSHLIEWYARFGFVPDGPEFVEDGIHHIPMVREVDPSR